VISKAVLEARRFDEHGFQDKLPWYGAICFPVIVVQGQLFEAYYDHEIADVKLAPVSRARLFWRASAANRRAISMIDVVAESELAPFLKTRRSDVEELMQAAEKATCRIEQALAQNSFEALKIAPAPRGIVGLPPLLAELYRSCAPKQT
jgi:hypothetical protein